jgi:RNA polymerase sigma-70 factor (ECF subfamily)
MNQPAINQQFTAIYEDESDGIFRFCLIRVSDREQALDLTQETFSRLWQSLIQGREMTNHRAFLFTVAHRLIIDWYRKKRPTSLEALSSDDETRESYDPPDDAAYDASGVNEEGRFLLSKISQLGHSYEHAVYLRFIEGLSPPEIGEVLGISANAASVRINRGLQELRKITGYEKNGDPKNNEAKIAELRNLIKKNA